MRAKRTPPIQRVWGKLDRTGSCWLWLAGCNPTGYGMVWDAEVGKNRGVHRVVWEHIVGPIPEGMTLDHLCRVRNCCNPAHLEVVSVADNIRRGTSPSANNARKTHCKHGHPFDAENTYEPPRRRGGRYCRRCARIRRGRE